MLPTANQSRENQIQFNEYVAIKKLSREALALKPHNIPAASEYILELIILK